MQIQRLLRCLLLIAAGLGLGRSDAAGSLPGIWIVTYDAPPGAAQLQALSGITSQVHAYNNLPMAAVVAPTTDYALIANLPGVRGVYPNKVLHPVLAQSTRTIHADGVWADGYTGHGIGIAIIDAGIDGTHPDLCAAPTFCNGTPVKTVQNVKIVGDQDLADPVVVLENQISTDSTSGHGSHVSGIAAGWGVSSQTLNKYRGVAWGARLIGLGTGEVLDVVTVLAGFDWVMGHYNDPRYNIKVINNSWGPGAGAQYDPNEPVQRAISIAHDAGLAVVFGSGNDGPKTGPINVFSINPKAISAAAGSKAGHIALFSSRGVPGSPLFRPTVTAPGQFIASVRARTGFYAWVADATGPDPNNPILPPDDAYYAFASGTSMSSPHVAGVIALMQEAAIRVLGRYLTPDEAKNLLQNTAVTLNASRGPGGLPNYQDYSMGAGYVDALAAVRAIEAGATSGLQPYNAGVVTDVRGFEGPIAASAAGSTSSFITTYSVLPGAISLDIMADWQYATLSAPATAALQIIDVDLYRPDGSLYLSTMLHLDTTEGPNQYSATFSNQPNQRINVNYPTSGQWRAVVHGTIAASDTVYGSWSVVYPAGTVLPPAQSAAGINVNGPAAPGVAGQTVTLTAFVTDAAGNPVLNAPVSWSSVGVGSVVTSEPLTDERGEAVATVRSNSPGSQTATAHSGTAAGNASVSWIGLPVLVGPAPANTPGRASGGGFINNPGKQTFGFYAEYQTQSSGPGGDLSFDDKAGTKVRATAIGSLVINGNQATFTGSASVNGNGGYNFQVDAVDNGQPATNDSFHLLVTSPANPAYRYETQGTLGGGNIQVQRY